MFVNFGCKDLLYLKTHCSCDSWRGTLPDNETDVHSGDGQTQTDKN
jgi:hypothetical protein